MRLYKLILLSAMGLLLLPCLSRGTTLTATVSVVPVGMGIGTTWDLDFQFNCGSASGDNTIFLTNFVATGWTAGTPNLATNVTGTLADGLTFTDELYPSPDTTIAMTTSSDSPALSFLVTYTTSPLTNPPDEFMFTIFDSTGNNDQVSAGNGALLVLDLGPYAVTPILTPADAGYRASFTTPEPGTALLFALGGALVLLARCKR